MPHGYKCNVTCEPPCLKLNLEQQSARTLCIRLNASTTSMDSPSISGRAGEGGWRGGGANWKGGGEDHKFSWSIQISNSMQYYGERFRLSGRTSSHQSATAYVYKNAIKPVTVR